MKGDLYASSQPCSSDPSVFVSTLVEFSWAGYSEVQLFLMLQASPFVKPFPSFKLSTKYAINILLFAVALKTEVKLTCGAVRTWRIESLVISVLWRSKVERQMHAFNRLWGRVLSPLLLRCKACTGNILLEICLKARIKKGISHYVRHYNHFWFLILIWLKMQIWVQ